MIDLDAPPATIGGVPPGAEDLPGSRRIHGGAAGGTEVDAGMHVAAGAVEVDRSRRSGAVPKAGGDGNAAVKGMAEAKGRRRAGRRRYVRLDGRGGAVRCRGCGGSG